MKPTCLICAIAALSALSLGAHAATYTVSNTNDAGINSLRRAISDANSNPGADTVDFNLGAGTHTITLTTGDIEITDEVMIQGPIGGTSTVIVSGNNASRVFHITDGPVEIRRLTITDGEQTGSEPMGGAVLVGTDAYFDVAGQPSIDVIFQNCTIKDSHCDFVGGGLCMNAPGALTLDLCTFSGNDSNYGAGVALRLCTSAVITDSNFLNNDAFLGGGGLDSFDFFDGTLDINRCTFSGNTASSGAAFTVGDPPDNGPTVNVTNTTISGNSARSYGGGVYFAEGTLTFTNCTITNNTANDNSSYGGGGGINMLGGAGDTITLMNTVVAGNFDTPDNSGTAPLSPDLFGDFISAGHNFIGDGTGSTGLADGVNGDLVGLDTARLDPVLDVLADNGGSTETHLVLGGSPLIDAGDSGAVISPPFSLSPYIDQRGNPRTAGLSTDIGSVEFQDVIVVDSLADAGGGSLRDAIAQANATGGKTIVFQEAAFAGSLQTITLTSGQIAITDSVSIEAPEVGVRVSGDNNSRIFNITGSGTGTVELKGLRLVNGDSTADGGAVRIVGASTEVVIRSCGISNNTAAGLGGGLYAEDATVTIRNSTLSGNDSASNGGALNANANSTVHLVQSTLSGNSADGNGGGLFAVNSAVRVLNCTVTDNTCDADNAGTAGTAGNGGGIRRGGGAATVHVGNTIIAGNFDASSGDQHPDVSGVFESLGHNLVGKDSGLSTGSGTPFTDGVNGDQVGTAASSIAPLLDTLALTSGDTRTHLLLTGSPAIDAGDDALLSDVAWAGNTPSRDQRGQWRVIDAAVDIGSVEWPDSEVVRITALDTQAHELGETDATYKFQRSFDVGNLDVQIERDPASTASGPDGSLSGASTVNTGPGTRQITIPDGAKSVILTLTATDDSLLEGDETSTFNLLPDAAYAIDGGFASATVTIVDNEFEVANANNDGPGSLRDAIALAEAAGGGTVTIPAGLGPISLNTQIIIDGEITIDGKDNVIDALGTSRHFRVDSSGGGCVLFKKLILTGGQTNPGLDGGSILIENTGTCVEIDRCAITGNVADNRGGGVAITDGELTIRRSSLDNNFADGSHGGGLFGLNATVTLVNSTFALNETVGSGGGIAFNDTDGVLVNITVTENVCDSDDSGSGNGGGIWVEPGLGDVGIVSCLIAGNKDASTSGDRRIDVAGELISRTHNLIGTNELEEIDFPAGQPNLKDDYVGTNAAPIDALLTPSGTTPLYYLFDNASLALGNGENALVASPPMSPVLVDQRGYDRIHGPFVDIGAVEMDYLRVNNTLATGAGSLRARIEEANILGHGTIVFNPAVFNVPQTIDLSVGATGRLTIDGPMSICGPAEPVTISAGSASRVLEVDTISNDVVLLKNLTFTEGNTLGAITVEGGGKTTFECCNITDSGIAGGAWGGLQFDGDPNALLELLSCTVSGNFSNTAAGLRLFGEGEVVIEHSTISGNTSDAGGAAIYSGAEGIGPNTTLLNSTISGNTAGSFYAAIFCFYGSIAAINCTITDNTTEDAILNSNGTISLANTIVAGNTVSRDINGTITDGGHNFIGIGGGTGVLDGVNGNQVGTGGAPLDPLLGPLQLNGGKTKNHRPLFGSPVVEAGNNSAPGILATDQRGNDRIQNTTIDVGADEFIPIEIYAIVDDATAAESPTDSQPGVLRIVRSRTISPLDVQLSLVSQPGSASLSDLALSVSGPGSVAGGVVTMPAGEAEVTVLVTPVDDAVIENVELAKLEVQPGVYSIVDPAFPTSDITITDNDFEVTDYGDSGPGTLREAVEALNAIDGGTITFDNFQLFGIPRAWAIRLDSTLVISSDITICGPDDNAAGIRLDGQGQHTVLQLEDSANVTLKNLSIANGNSVVGAGIYMTNFTSLTVERCLFTGNHASENAGAIFSNAAGFLTLRDTTFSGNSSDLSGAAYYGFNTIVTATNCTITDNTSDANSDGSGVGALVKASGTITLQNTIVAGNHTNDPGGTKDIGGGMISLGGNLIGDNSGTGGSPGSFPAGLPNANGDYVGDGTRPLDPVLGALQQNGGPTRTHALGCSSPALDNGVSAGLSATDQRSLARIDGPGVDIGALEHQFLDYDYWRDFTFPKDEDSMPFYAAHLDYDGDGHANGLERLFGSDPTDPDSFRTFETLRIGTDLVLQFDRPFTLDPAKVRAEESVTGQAWTPGPINYEHSCLPGSEDPRLRAFISMNASQTKLGRILYTP